MDFSALVLALICMVCCCCCYMFGMLDFLFNKFEWSQCYSDEDGDKAGVGHNRDVLINAECIKKGGTFNKANFKDCGNWKFSGRCDIPRF